MLEQLRGRLPRGGRPRWRTCQAPALRTFMEPAPQRSWFGRNWLWVVPVGCLAPLLLCCGLPMLIALVAGNALKSSEVYKDAGAKAQARAEVKEAVGEPIEPSSLVTGTLDEGSGQAVLAVPLTGPKGMGALEAKASKQGGKWEFTTLRVTAGSK